MAPVAADRDPPWSSVSQVEVRRCWRLVLDLDRAGEAHTPQRLCRDDRFWRRVVARAVGVSICLVTRSVTSVRGLGRPMLVIENRGRLLGQILSQFDPGHTRSGPFIWVRRFVKWLATAICERLRTPDALLLSGFRG